jgi:hypothetical protein
MTMNADELAADPVIEAYKEDLDVTLLEESLRRTPEERILAIMDMQRLIEEMRRRNPGSQLGR